MTTQKITQSIFDVFVGVLIFILAAAVSTIGLTIKANQYKTDQTNQIKVTVYKKPIPVLASTKGIIQKVHVRPGQEVRRGDVLVEIDNPLLKGKIEALKNYPDNLSARTEAEVAQIELEYLNVSSPVDGVVSDISVTDGAPVQELAPLVTLYSNEDVTLVADLDTDQYLQVKQQSKVPVYNPRLNQIFLLTPSLVRPDVQLPETPDTDAKKIGLYFTLAKSSDASSLLQNEDMQIDFDNQTSTSPTTPLGAVVKFWNSLLFTNK